MDLTDAESEFIEIYRKAKQNNNTDVTISIYATFGAFLEEQGAPQSIPPFMEFTRGQYKRAIRSLRTVQARSLHMEAPDRAAECDRLVRYIREHCLQRTAAAAGKQNRSVTEHQIRQR